MKLGLAPNFLSNLLAEISPGKRQIQAILNKEYPMLL